MELRARKASSVECWAWWMGKHGLRMIKMGKRRGVTVASFRLHPKNKMLEPVETSKMSKSCCWPSLNVSQCTPNVAPRVPQARLEAVKTTARLGRALGRLGRSPWSSANRQNHQSSSFTWSNLMMKEVKELQSCNSSTWPRLPHIASRNVGAQKGLCHSWKMIPTSVIRFLMAYLHTVGLIQLEHQPQIRVNSDATRKLQLRCPGTSSLELGTLHSSPPATFACHETNAI